MYRFKGNILIAGLLMILALASCSTRRQLKALYEGQLDTVLFNMPKGQLCLIQSPLRT